LYPCTASLLRIESWQAPRIARIDAMAIRVLPCLLQAAMIHTPEWVGVTDFLIATL
jgi:hypothetical protein